jgi:hypothetical protein
MPIKLPLYANSGAIHRAPVRFSVFIGAVDMEGRVAMEAMEKLIDARER